MVGFLSLDRNRPRKVVFYGRVSTEHEAQLSALENQMQWYEDIAKRYPNWTVVDKYIDEGITGTQAKKRPSFMKMIADSQTGKFDLIVTREVCRFARNTVDTLTHTRALKNLNIEVFFVDDNIWTMDGDGELRLTIMATLAQEESRKVSERVKAGQHISREKKIIYGCGNILGYELKRNIGDDGKWDPSENTYIINPEQAETVRMIFDLYEQGLGAMKIAKELQYRERLTAMGKTKWCATNISKILKNVTYKGYIGYYKSYSNNYLEQKRIQNHDDETYVCVKGNFEAIISEEQWDRCQAIMKGKKKYTVVRDGDAQNECRRSSSSMWVKKLRCSCGSTFRKNRYHKDKDGNVTYNFVCYNQVNYGKASSKAKLGLDTEGYCDEAPITEWKLDLMAKYFLDEAWKSKADDLMTALSYIQKYYLSATKNNTQKSQAVTDLQIDKVEKRIKSLITMFADGSVTKDEFDTMKADYNTELAKLKEQRFTTDEQQEIVENCMFDMAYVSKALYEMVNAQNTELSNDLLDEMVSSITVENRRYVWHYRYATQKKSNTTIEVEGKKKTPVIRIDGTPANTEKEASDEASDIHKFEKSIISEYGEKKLSLIQTLHRQRLAHQSAVLICMPPAKPP